LNAQGFQVFQIEFLDVFGSSVTASLRRDCGRNIIELYKKGATGGYAAIDPRLDTSLATPWYSTPKYSNIKAFMTWLGWNEANPLNFATLQGQPTIGNLLRFLKGLSTPI
jgi:hypothetical protein